MWISWKISTFPEAAGVATVRVPQVKEGEMAEAASYSATVHRTNGAADMTGGADSTF